MADKETKHPKVRTQWDRVRVQKAFNLPSMTVQAEADNANMGTILRRFTQGLLPPRRGEPLYANVANIKDRHHQENVLAAARSEYNELPHEKRNEYATWQEWLAASLSPQSDEVDTSPPPDPKEAPGASEAPQEPSTDA